MCIRDRGTQYAIEYRVKKKDGGYLWVHDVGRKVTADDGREVIISVLILSLIHIYGNSGFQL